VLSKILLADVNLDTDLDLDMDEAMDLTAASDKRNKG
jgi:hypothetical protein